MIWSLITKLQMSKVKGNGKYSSRPTGSEVTITIDRNWREDQPYCLKIMMDDK